ncbi:hypothetical protein BGP_1789 [Beggiatoa sp. PS]|nr:hypothetical protein BGP_1789 [Beggiatoa sp. PS]
MVIGITLFLTAKCVYTTILLWTGKCTNDCILYGFFHNNLPNSFFVTLTVTEVSLYKSSNKDTALPANPCEMLGRKTKIKHINLRFIAKITPDIV